MPVDKNPQISTLEPTLGTTRQQLLTLPSIKYTLITENCSTPIEDMIGNDLWFNSDTSNGDKDTFISVYKSITVRAG